MIRPCFFQKKRIFSKVCILANQTQKTLWRGVGHFWTVQEAQISSRSETKGYLPSQYTQILVVDTFGPNLKIFTEKSCHNTLKVVNKSMSMFRVIISRLNVTYFTGNNNANKYLQVTKELKISKYFFFHNFIFKFVMHSDYT